MRPIRYLLTAVLLCLLAAPLLAQKQIQLLATITDPTGAPVTTIDPKDVHVTENGMDATVTKVEPVERVPKVQILIDIGVGMPREAIGDVRTAVQGLIMALPPTIETTLVATAPQPHFVERATTDRAKLLAAVDRLSPDNGAGQFVESLDEAMERIDKDKQQDAAYTIVAVGTSSGDLNVRDSEVKAVMDKVQRHHTMVHVVLLQSSSGSLSGGGIQTDVGQAVSKLSGGRYEGINVSSRLVTLLPEIGAQMAKTLGGGSRQFRITFDRPSGASGDLGRLSMGIAGKLASNVMVDHH